MASEIQVSKTDSLEYKVDNDIFQTTFLSSMHALQDVIRHRLYGQTAEETFFVPEQLIKELHLIVNYHNSH